MKILRVFSYLAITLLLCLPALALSSTSQINRYAKDGLSFQYPSDWSLQDESDEEVQILSLRHGQIEAEIIVVALRQQMTSQQLAQIQPLATQAITDDLTQSLRQAGGRVIPSSVSVTVGGRQASGTRLRAVIHGEAGNADVYWVVLGGRIIHLLIMGSDPEFARAVSAWNMVCNTLRAGEGEAATTQHVRIRLRATSIITPSED